jgi:feruloyl-CoA synthase
MSAGAWTLYAETMSLLARGSPKVAGSKGDLMSLEWVDDPRWLAPPRGVRVALDEGFVLRSPEPLKPYARCIGEWLERWAAETPDAPAFAERQGDGEFRQLTWRELRAQVGRIAQGLLDLQLKPGAPVVVLSDNALEHLLLMLAAMHVGVPVCTVSSAYCRLTRDFSKIHGILQALGPALVYASDARVYGPAIAGAALDAVVVFGSGAEAHPGALPFSRLAQCAEGPQVMAAFAAITPDAHAKYLLTSGSTGQPKVVVNTHRMLCANQQMVAQAWCFLDHEKPVLVDWLPWSHTFGGNHNLHMVLRSGGTMVIDEGRPAPGLVEKSVANLAQVQPTIWFNVPRGFDMALPLLEADEALARRLFERLRVVFYAGAALPQATWERLQALARRVRGEEVWLTTSWGSTETSPAITSAHWRLDRAGVIGGVLPGLELKFVPNGGKLEMRVRGVSIFPGYRNAPELTAQAFDAEGYYCIGDAGYLADEEHPERGVVFDGRVAEDFKLTTGTWVSVGTLRVQVVSALAPLAQDVVITGHDRDEVGVLVFPTPAAAALPAPELAARVAQALGRLRAAGGGSSQCPGRALVLAEPPSADAGEITDKGYINQRAVLQRRAAQVDQLYAGGEGVIVPQQV